jgi:hypothetical protein
MGTSLKIGVLNEVQKKKNLVQHIEEVEYVFASEFSRIPCFHVCMDRWKYWIDKASSEKSIPLESSYKGYISTETYSHFIEFPDGSEFQFEWDIVKAVRWFESQNINKLDMVIDRLTPFMTLNEINFNDPAMKVPQHPIIAIHSCLIDMELIVINGNHRIIEAKQNGELMVNGYILQNHRHREWMRSEEMKLYYEFLLDHQAFQQEIYSIRAGNKHDENTFLAKLNIGKKYGGGS